MLPSKRFFGCSPAFPALLALWLAACAGPSKLELTTLRMLDDPSAAPTAELAQDAGPEAQPPIETPPVGSVQAPPPALSEACRAVASEAINEVTNTEAIDASRPMDVVLVIDNSRSMSDEIAELERNINLNFSQILADSGIDYRVLMVSAYRAVNGALAQNGVCVDPPLGPSACAERAGDASPHHDRFFHFDQPIGSEDALCLLLETQSQAPVATTGRGSATPTRADDPLSQRGWTAMLRPDAFKAFIMIGDDTISCGWNSLDFGGNPLDAAKSFDFALRALVPHQFGSIEEERKYAWHSIVGIAPKDDQYAVYEAEEPLNLESCATAEEPGAPHQELSRLTDGLRYPVCNSDSYDNIFKRIATRIVEDAQRPCSWSVPSVPEGTPFDRDKVNLSYTPGNGSSAPDLGRVGSETECGDVLGWYYDDPVDPSNMNACPVACELITSDAQAQVNTLFGCPTVPSRSP